jgi:hypothetical protein
MKSLLPLFVFSSVLTAVFTIGSVAKSAQSQPAGTSTAPQPAGPVSPQSPGLPASPIVPGLPGFNYQNQIISGSTFPNGAGPQGTNQFIGTSFSGDLAVALQNLQAAIAQNLPAIQAYTETVDFAQANNTNGISNTSASRSGAAGVRNDATLQSSSLASNNGANFATLAATPTGPSLVSQTGGTTTVTPLGATGSTNSNTLLGASGGLGGNPNISTTFGQLGGLRGLIVLQADLERSLQILANLNGNGLGLPNGGSFANGSNSVAQSQSGVIQAPGSSTTTTTTPTPGTTTRSQALTPTGR